MRSLLGFWIGLSAIICHDVQGQGDPLIQPPIIDSSGGVLDISLTLEYANHNGPFYSLTNARLLNGMLPGPTLRLEAGDTLKILFQNLLEQQPGTTFATNEFTKPDHSNLHFHGGHVSGELPSDDVRHLVAPGESYQYETKFPDDHMPGTHWIHPHAHGSSSVQVGGGAALAMIVKDQQGFLPTQVADAEDVLLFIQHLDFGELNDVIDAHNDGIFSASVNGGGGNPNSFAIVNGQYQPVVSMQPGEWQRWRVVMAGWLGIQLDFQIPSSNCEMQLLSKDGIYIRDFPRETTVLPLAAGGRADVMVRCSQAGTYNVINIIGATVMTISVSGTNVNSDDLEPWTPVYPDYLKDLRSTSASPGCSCVTEFTNCGGGGGGGGGFGGGGGGPVCINGELFDEDVYLHTVAFGSVVERDLRDVDDHPYHQHVYPFQIVSINNIRDADHAAYYQLGDWQDVIMIEARSVIVRYRADVHTGVIMVHCHILPHEDEGTMTQELVVDGGDCDCEAFYVQPPSAPIPAPSKKPSKSPTQKPSLSPSSIAPEPSSVPSRLPSNIPSLLPSEWPSEQPSLLSSQKALDFSQLPSTSSSQDSSALGSMSEIPTMDSSGISSYDSSTFATSLYPTDHSSVESTGSSSEQSTEQYTLGTGA